MSQSNIVSAVTSEYSNKRLKRELSHEAKKIKGSVILMKKNFLDMIDIAAAIRDYWDDMSKGQKVSLQLISAVNGEPGNGNRGKLGRPAYLEWKCVLPNDLNAEFHITFDWDEEIGVPGAVLVRNTHENELYFRTLTLEDVPGQGRVHFVCNSWVYPVQNYKKDRIFFPNKPYLPHETPFPLRDYREEELANLRGDGTGERQEYDRIYDYAYYNDLGEPDTDPKLSRPVLGGSAKYPYPRRMRTGRPSSKTDDNTESRPEVKESFYVPRDEQFGTLKESDFIADEFKSRAQLFGAKELLDSGKEFESYSDVLTLYEGGIDIPEGIIEYILTLFPLEFLKEIFRSDGEKLLKFPKPRLIKDDLYAWLSDEEFGREMLAGVNPVAIRRLEEFPPKSKLGVAFNSKITKKQLAKSLGDLEVDVAIRHNRLFILDYHDAIMSYLRRINETPSSKTYATRTILFLKDDGTLKPVAIELSLPNPKGDFFGDISKVFTPAGEGIDESFWLLAKAFVAVNDSGYHQLISHWLNTHAVIEPFVIATNRQLSVLHPIYKLLHPHFRDTLSLNGVARKTLTSAVGVIESTFFPGKYSMELSSAVYKDWVFSDQALPKELKKRGMAIEDKNGCHLVIEDYPYAVDGLEIWAAIKTWVTDYCSFYYSSDFMVQYDSELQSWWKELREEGHGDKRNEAGWPKMQTFEELTETLTIIIWIASALHAAVNFGQYAYAGYFPNRPTSSRRLLPEKGTPEYEDLESDPRKVFFKTIASLPQALNAISVMELLSRHSKDEVYLGQRDTPEWTTDAAILQAFKKFGDTLSQIEARILERNKDPKLRNRRGPANVPYLLLYPTSEIGLTAKGIPNSVSI